MKIKIEYILLIFCLLIFFSCNQKIEKDKTSNDSKLSDTANSIIKVPILVNENNELDVTINQQDSIDPISDINYGYGDDDLFSASEASIIYTKNSRFINVSNKLNDYNLQTSFTTHFTNFISDTFNVIIYFGGLGHSRTMDTLIIISEIDIFNGNRKSLKEWNASGLVKQIQLFNGKTHIGDCTLKDTYKMQTINLGNKPLVNTIGKSDTLKLIIKSVYNNTSDKKYSISEIKFSGQKYY